MSFACLLNPRWFLNYLVEIDFRKDMEGNDYFKNLSPDKKEERLDGLKRGTIERRGQLLKRLKKSSLCILGGIASALLAVGLIHHCASFTLTGKLFMAIASLSCYAFATLARLDWEGRTWGGTTVFEQLDDNIFGIMYFLGTFFGVASILI